jgi:hypothetical protein
VAAAASLGQDGAEELGRTTRMHSSAEKKALCDRLEADYHDRFAAIGGGFSAWTGGTRLGVEALFGGRSGPMWSASVRFAKRRGYWIGRLQALLSLDEAEDAIRADIEKYLSAHTAASDQVESP